MAASLAAEAENSRGLHYKNPRLPLNIKLPDNLECGTKVYIHGAVALQAERFSVNFKDAAADANTYFHFNPRFKDEVVVVRNSRLNDAWGPEERDGDSPFVPGEEFLMSIQATVDGYEVHVNGNPFTVFQHREGMPLCNVTHLTMKGDVVCYGIHLPLTSLPIPLMLGVPGKTCIGDVFSIDGEVPDGSDRFAVNLQCGGEDTADIMFHLNPRFGDGVAVCNSRCADAWDAEEREGLPIGVGEAFNLCLAASSEAYHTFVNEKAFVKFNHRLNMAAACTLYINGDIRVFNVSINCPPSKSPPQGGDANIGEVSVATFYPSNPVVLALPSPLEPGKVVVLAGVVAADATRFKLNLQCGEGDGDDVALHVNPRWDSDGGPILVFNSHQSGDWGEEIRSANNVNPGSNIEIFIRCQEDGYFVSLNKNVAVQCFPHRLECRRVSHVVVDGCVAVQRIVSA